MRWKEIPRRVLIRTGTQYLIIISIAIFTKIFIITVFKTEMSSMYPTIKDTEFVLVNKAAYWFFDPKRGDVIAFSYPPDPEIHMIKRILALPDENFIYTRDRNIYINQKKLNSRSLGNSIVYESADNQINWHVIHTPDRANQLIVQDIPEDHYFVMGDNRDNSEDSRAFGFVPRDSLLGKVHQLPEFFRPTSNPEE